MKIVEAEKKFNLPKEVLEQYISFGFIRPIEEKAASNEYRDGDFARLGLIDTLVSAGFTPDETKRFLTLTEKAGTDEQQIRMLRKRRRTLLDDIHKKQQLLDNLDFMILDRKHNQ